MADKPEIPGMELKQFYKCLTCGYEPEDDKEAKTHGQLPVDKPLPGGLCFKISKSVYQVVGTRTAISTNHDWLHIGYRFILNEDSEPQVKWHHLSTSSAEVRGKLKTGEYLRLDEREIELFRKLLRNNFDLCAHGILGLVLSENSTKSF